ncbi:hypothetical protein ABIF68_004206 [Bradyrhizobium japonicum]|jgi:hypothetical protein
MRLDSTLCTAQHVRYLLVEIAPSYKFEYLPLSRRQCSQTGAIRIQLALFPVGRSKSPGYGHLKLPHLMIAVSAAEQQ